MGEVLEWTSAQGQEYWYRVPKKQRGKPKPVLVFMLHGTGLNHGWSFWNYPIADGTFRGDDIVVSPDGLTPGNGDTFNFVQNKKDGEQIVALIKHFRSKLAKDRVAIGILHARSDQVVPAECAERTENIYHDQDYRKVKCWIVDGIRDQAGHWPLPTHVATMFEWLDEVSTSNPVQAFEVARSALAEKEPNFAVKGSRLPRRFSAILVD